MSLKDFQERIRASTPPVLAGEYLLAPTAHVFESPESYSTFRGKVSALFGATETIAVVGSGNWKFSLNPEKSFRKFGQHSDIDVAVISRDLFNGFWEEMRFQHRAHFYQLPFDYRERLRRNSENVYAGFISPNWIPNRNPRTAYEYKRNLDSLSDRHVQFLKVKMMFFKNFDEATDYYARGFRMAQRATT
jgi:hypothetical protein